MKIENLGVFLLNLKIEIIIVLSFHPGNLLFLFSFYGIIRGLQVIISYFRQKSWKFVLE